MDNEDDDDVVITKDVLAHERGIQGPLIDLSLESEDECSPGI